MPQGSHGAAPASTCNLVALRLPWILGRKQLPFAASFLKISADLFVGLPINKNAETCFRCCAVVDRPFPCPLPNWPARQTEWRFVFQSQGGYRRPPQEHESDEDAKAEAELPIGPVAGFSAQPTCVGTTVVFTDRSAQSDDRWSDSNQR